MKQRDEKKKSKRKVQGVPQSQATALPTQATALPKTQERTTQKQHAPQSFLAIPCTDS